MIIDIDNKLLDGLLVDAFNTLGEDVRVSFEERVVVDRSFDFDLFKNINSLKLNDTLVKTNMANLSEILKNSNKSSIEVNLEGTNPVAAEIFSLIMNDIDKGNVLRIAANEEMEQNGVTDNLAFLSSKTKNEKLQEEERESFLNAAEAVVNNLKSNLLARGSYHVSYNEEQVDFSLDRSIHKGLSVLSNISTFFNTSFGLPEVMDTINCYSNCHCNCHSNCHSACHGSRGWR